MVLQSIQRASDSQARLVHQVGIDLGRRHILVAQQFLHRADIRSPLQQMRRKRMAQHIRRHLLAQLRPRAPSGTKCWNVTSNT